MQVSQPRSIFSQPEHPLDWPIHSNSPRERADAMHNRIEQPLIFSIDDRLTEQHLTRLDLVGRRLKRIEPLQNGIQFNVINFDQNEISKIEHLDTLTQLIQLSISHNRLDDIRALHRLRSLQKLNLSYNLIDSIDSLRNLQNLVMLNLSNNNISSLSALNACHTLQSLDASCNAIQQIDDFTRLTSLKYLNLHKNYIDSLLTVPRYWPKSLHTLVISDNELQDLTEIACLSSFIDLNALYIENNPCLSVVDERHGCYQPFDYRPYVLNWCLTINNLDGVFITRKESLKAEWLLSQGKGRSFRSGDHAELVEYLIKVCGTDANERDDLHLSRIMFQQEMYQQKQNSTPDINVHGSTTMMTSDTMRDAYETISTNSDGKVHTSTITTEPEVVRDIRTTGPPRTPSPGYTRLSSASHTITDDSRTDHSRYSQYDNRPIKPLDQRMLQTKLNEYPVENVCQSSTNVQSTKRPSSQLAYNANRYSPKITARGPTASNALHIRSNKTSSRHSNLRLKRAARMSSNSVEQRASSHLTTKAVKATTTEERQAIIITSIENKKTLVEGFHDDQSDDEFLTTAPKDHELFTRSTAINNSIEIQRLTCSMETMRTSVLQAYFDLHDRFTKTTELQTSALTALWKRCETQSLTFESETEKILQENRSLHHRIEELERRLDEKERRHHPQLHPPLRAHISKRDTKSFFLHWIPNPLNEHRKILGYRIYIDDRLKGAIDPGQFEAIIDSIRDEGQYRIKIRTYDEHGESTDSNVVIARFRRQPSLTPCTTEYIIDDQDERQENLVNSTREETRAPIVLDKRWSDSAIPFFQEQQIPVTTPEKISKPLDERISPLATSPMNSNQMILCRKPPRSPNSSPSHSGKVSPNSGSCNKVLFTNPTHQGESTTIRTAKRSPTRTGIMSRLAKSPYRIKRTNNALFAALPNESTEIISSSDPMNHTDLNDMPDMITMDRMMSNTSPSPPPLPPRIGRMKTTDDS